MDPFAKGIPTIFIIGTPFQMLCALQAIRDFEITDYDVFITSRFRDYQMLPLLDKFKIKYQYVELFAYHSRKKWIKALFSNGRYKRAFIGHFQNKDMYFEALMHLGFGSYIIYMDDGTATLKLLMGYEKVDYKDSFFIKVSLLCGLKRIAVGNSLYTMFFDYNKDMFKYCEKNNLDLYRFNKMSLQKGIYVIGTNFAGYKRDYSCDIDSFLLHMKSMFKYLKTKYDNVYYIPHGCDDGSVSKKLCQDYSVEFLKLDRPVEVYFIENGIIPYSVYGFTSTALYVLKNIYVNLNVGLYNVVSKFCMEREPGKVLRSVTSIFSAEGIETIYIEDFDN